MRAADQASNAVKNHKSSLGSSGQTNRGSPEVQAIFLAYTDSSISLYAKVLD